MGACGCAAACRQRAAEILLSCLTRAANQPPGGQSRNCMFSEFELTLTPGAPTVPSGSYKQTSCHHRIHHHADKLKRVPSASVSSGVSLGECVAASACAAVPAGVTQPVNIEWAPTAQKITAPVYSGPCARADFQEE